jgi:signal transduction histidine kinase
MGIVVVWEPLYVLQGFLKLGTAVLSVAAAVALWPLIPKAVALPSRSMLEERDREIDSLTTLAGGISHDFNNLLTVIIGSAEDLQHEENPQARADSIDRILQCTDRATGLCRSMLAFSGYGHFRLEPLALSESIQPVLNGLAERGDAEAEVPLQLELDLSLPPIKASPSQLGELVTELVTNAREAVGDRSGAAIGDGRVTVATRLEFLDGQTLDRSRIEHPLAPGHHVVLEVVDNGIGMAPELVERMFEPYRTTRFFGRGLGLAAVHGIARGHKAALLVDSVLGEGTRVRVVFAQAAVSRVSV